MRRASTLARRRRRAGPGARARLRRGARRRRQLVRQPRQHDVVGTAVHAHRALLGAPMQRSMTPNTPSPGLWRRRRRQATARPRSGFMSGLMGGLIGAGIGGLLFGHGFFGGDAGVRRLPRLPAADLPDRAAGSLPDPSVPPRQSPAFAGGPDMFARGGPPGPARWAASAGPAGPPPIQIGPQDYQAFEQLLQDIQAAWSRA